MTMLTDLYEDPFYEEERMYLYSALFDMRFARYMLRSVGQAERDRFSEVGFAYGDDSYFGYSPDELYQEQLNNVLYTLFGDGFSGELISIPLYDDGESTLKEIAAIDGGPICLDDPRYYNIYGWYGGDYEEVLVTEIRAYSTGTAGAHGRGATARQRLDALTSAMRRATGEAGSPALHRWREDSQRLQQLRHNAGGGEHVLFANVCELYAPQEMMHGCIFERLMEAWREFEPPEDTKDAENTDTTERTDPAHSANPTGPK